MDPVALHIALLGEQGSSSALATSEPSLAELLMQNLFLISLSTP
jgi:hypothetical protein